MRVHLCPQNLLVLNQWLGRDGLGPGGLESFGIPGRPKSIKIRIPHHRARLGTSFSLRYPLVNIHKTITIFNSYVSLPEGNRAPDQPPFSASAGPLSIFAAASLARFSASVLPEKLGSGRWFYYSIWPIGLIHCPFVWVPSLVLGGWMTLSIKMDETIQNMGNHAVWVTKWLAYLRLDDFCSGTCHTPSTFQDFNTAMEMDENCPFTDDVPMKPCHVSMVMLPTCWWSDRYLAKTEQPSPFFIPGGCWSHQVPYTGNCPKHPEMNDRSTIDVKWGC